MTAFALPAHLEALNVDELWLARERLRLERQRLAEEVGRCEQELAHRCYAARPDFTSESGGSVELAGDSIVVVMTFARDYVYDERGIMELAQSEELTAAEYNDLVQFVPKVSGTVFNAFCKRGGDLSERLLALRTLKNARPEFKPKSRSQ